jgi:hypothetical protein
MIYLLEYRCCTKIFQESFNVANSMNLSIILSTICYYINKVFNRVQSIGTISVSEW